MTQRKIIMEPDKKIALVAHDNKKRDLVEWAKYNRNLLAHHEVYATGTTGEILESALGFKINRLQSGPLGGDQQIGAKIVDNEIDFLIFFWDPLEPMPHDSDVKALLAHGGGVEHSHCLQPSDGGLHDLLATDGWRVRPPGARLCRISYATDRLGRKP